MGSNLNSHKQTLAVAASTPDLNDEIMRLVFVDMPPSA